jgi:hypothetical protein
MRGELIAEGAREGVEPPTPGTDAIEPIASRARARIGGRWPRLDAPTQREIILALALLLSYGFFQQVPAWNEYSRYDLVRALVEDGTTSIDRYHENTGDKALYNGHYYSDKAPGTAFLGVPVYQLLTLTSGAAGAGIPDPSLAVQALAFGVSGITTVLLVLLLFRFLRTTVGEGWALVVSVGYGLGSIAFPFATMFFGHAASAFFLFASFYLLWRWRATGGGWRPVTAGLLAGGAVITEIPVVLGVAILGGYALWIGRHRALGFVLGGIPVLLVLMAYNGLTFGGPFTLGYQYATEFGEQNRQGIVSIVWPSWTTMSDLLFGPRGLVRLAPWFSLAPLGVLAWRRRAIRPEVLVCVAICGVFLAYNSGALNPFGGWTPGPRYLLPALPFAAVLVALAPSVLRPLTAALIAVAIAVLFVATVTMPNAPEAYRDPLYDLWLPSLLNRDIAQTIAWPRWGLHGIQPLIVLVLGLIAAAAGLLATFRPGSAIGRLPRLAVVALILLIVAFALPFWPQAVVALSPSSGRAVGSIEIVDAGLRPVRTSEFARSSIWTQIENNGPSVDGTRVVFTAVTPDGSPAWSAWYGDVAWTEGERKRIAMEWDTTRAESGDYRIEVTVVSSDLRTVYSRSGSVGMVRVEP